MTKKTIQVDNLTLKYGENVIVDNASFTAISGDIIGIIGENGAGKTTLFKALVGLKNIYSGEVSSFGTSLKTDESKYKQNIGFVPDSPYILEMLTGYEFLNFISSMWSIKTNWEEIDSLSRKLAIHDHLDEYLINYSFGMKKKMSILTAMIHHPKIIILDEPLNGLDFVSANNVLKFIEYFAQNGGTVIYSTHQLGILAKNVNRLFLLKEKKIIDVPDIDKMLKESNSENIEEYYINNMSDEHDK
uniref:Immunity protein n=1 Tax=Leuconostoc mesenteroides TaxID=1245 RepID=A0A068Q723_LEUME|nr:immunity protein [Leuconostoc mesenteroides]